LVDAGEGTAAVIDRQLRPKCTGDKVDPADKEEDHRYEKIRQYPGGSAL